MKTLIILKCPVYPTEVVPEALLDPVLREATEAQVSRGGSQVPLTPGLDRLLATIIQDPCDRLLRRRLWREIIML